MFKKPSLVEAAARAARTLSRFLENQFRTPVVQQPPITTDQGGRVDEHGPAKDADTEPPLSFGSRHQSQSTSVRFAGNSSGDHSGRAPAPLTSITGPDQRVTRAG